MLDWTISADNRDGLCEKIRQLSPLVLWTCTIREKKSKRTIDQNKRLWALYNYLGAELGLEADEVHQLMGFKFLRYQKQVGDKAEEFIKSTTKLTTAEMVDYQESIERWALQGGFYFNDRGY
jgi:hypothetical protein